MREKGEGRREEDGKGRKEGRKFGVGKRELGEMKETRRKEKRENFSAARFDSTSVDTILRLKDSRKMMKKDERKKPETKVKVKGRRREKQKKHNKDFSAAIRFGSFGRQKESSRRHKGQQRPKEEDKNQEEEVDEGEKRNDDR